MDNIPQGEGIVLGGKKKEGTNTQNRGRRKSGGSKPKSQGLKDGI